MSTRKILISCEHADHLIPSSYSKYFENAQEDLLSHKGYDPGSLDIGKFMSRQITAPLFMQKVSRLLVEMNRSLHAQDLYSKYSILMPEATRMELLGKYYHPYRNDVEQKIKSWIESGSQVLHLSIHTFTPTINGVERMVDIGILCDEQDAEEMSWSQAYKEKLSAMLPNHLVMINLPYNGADDGFTTYLRQKYQSNYLGIEIEINQKYINQSDWTPIKKALVGGLS